MDNIFTVCMIVGILIPLCSFLLGNIFHAFDAAVDGILDLFNVGFDFDLCVDIGGTNLCVLPLSLQSLSVGAAVYGSVGKFLYTGDNLIFTNVVAGGSAYLIATAIQTMIGKLKKIENTTYTKEDLLLFDAKVVNSITKGGYGSVSITTYDGITTTYPAKALHDGEYIKQDSIVRVDHFGDNIAYVIPKTEEDDDELLKKKYDKK